MSTHLHCASCGVEFCIPSAFEAQRRKDHQDFYCPNGHPNVYRGKTEQEKRIDALEANNRRLSDGFAELVAQREELVGVLKECPIPGCGWRSRRQVPRDPVSMGRGIERVRADLLEHFVVDHSGRALAPKELTA